MVISDYFSLHTLDYIGSLQSQPNIPNFCIVAYLDIGQYNGQFTNGSNNEKDNAQRGFLNYIDHSINLTQKLCVIAKRLYLR